MLAKRGSSLVAALVFTAGSLAPQSATAAKISLIRDAEIELSIRLWATPLFESAGLIPDDIRIFLVQDRRINAFVAGGENLFIHTGLLMRSDNPGQIMGVIAHETGHIEGRHLARREEAMRVAAAQSIIGTLLGAAVGVAAGRFDAGLAGIGAGQAYAQRNLLRYNREQEQSADQAALRYLDANGISAAGLLEFFGVIGGDERTLARAADPYLRSHPITAERVQLVREHVQRSSYSERRLPEAYEIQHRRMRGKLIGFLEPPEKVYKNYYRSDDMSLEARYARTIAAYRKADLDTALTGINELLAEQPNDPFFHELRGQMLHENGRGREAVPSYERAVQLLPEAGLLRLELAQALVELDDRAADAAAIAHLNTALRGERGSSLAWRLLAVAHGRAGDLGMSSLALAEQALLQGKGREAIGQALRAERMLPTGSPGWLRALDIQRAAEDLKG
jgi:predicted Zn-dependent protease